MTTSTLPLHTRRQALGIRRLSRLSEQLRGRINDAIRAEGFEDFTDAHTQVFFNLESEGTRTTTLASRARISAQAMGKLVRDLESKGYVYRAPDPTDGRAQLVRLTARGESFFEVGVSVIEAQERALASLVGQEAYDAMVATATALLDHLDPDGF